MDRCWLLTWTTYATWLPGDVRGFVTDLHDLNGEKYRPNQPGTEYPAGIVGLRKYAEETLTGPPVWLTLAHAELLLPQFRETVAHRGWTIFITAVMTNHVHVILGVPGDRTRPTCSVA